MKFSVNDNTCCPVAAFVESFNHQPVQQLDGSWLWSYDVTVGRVVHTAKLFGQTVSEGFAWRMSLSKQDFYTDFEWFTGLSNLPATEGTWTLNQDPNNPNPSLSIEWNRNTQDSTADIKYIYIETNGLEFGSYIFYGISNNLPDNAFYDIFSQNQNNGINIEWHRDYHIDMVNDLLHFGNNDWQCWNGMLMNDTCP